MSPRLALAALGAFAAFLVAPAAGSAQTTPTAYTSATRYDAAGRVTGTISANPDAAGLTGAYIAVRNSYDAAGRLIRVESGTLSGWEPDGVAPAAWPSSGTGPVFTVLRTLETQYDAVGHKLRETLHEGVATGTIRGLTQYSYDNVGRLECTAVWMNPALYGSLPSSACTQATPAGSDGPDRITRTVYDAASQRVQARSGVGTVDEAADATFAYDADGQITAMIDANGNRAAYVYDGFERQVSWIFPSTTAPTAYDFSTQASALASAGSANAADHEDYTYDANGNRTSLRKRDGSVILYGYDALNRMTVKDLPGTSEDPAWFYDNQGHVTTVLFLGSGQGYANGYDGFGRLVSTISTMGLVVRTLTYQYDADGNRTRITHPDGVHFDGTYDGLDRPSYMSHSSSHGIAQANYTPFGAVADVQHGAHTTYGYDGIQRLSSMGHAFAATGTATAVNWVFGYSPANQLTTVNRDNDAFAFTGLVAGSRAYSTNGLNQYSAVDGTHFTYDANGNLTSSTPASGPSDTYVYDTENHLVSVTGAHNANLAYDPMGRLWQLTNTANGAVTRFLYDGDALVAEYDGGTTMLHRYAHWVGADVPLVAYDTSSLATPHHLYADHQGSIIAQAGDSGVTSAVNSYDEYGMPATTNQGRFQYTGQVWLDELGLYYYKARIYSPGLGRFLQTDPIGYAGGDNLYAYVGDDPVDRVDPSGDAPAAGALAGWGCFETGLCQMGIQAGAEVGTHALGESLEEEASAEGAGQTVAAFARGTLISHTVGAAIVNTARAQMLSAMARGRANEARVLGEMGLTKNTTAVSTSEGTAIPDAMTRHFSIEIKDVDRVTLTRQSRIEIGAAHASGRQALLITGRYTQISAPAQGRWDRIIRRDNLGPQNVTGSRIRQ